jgi:hypothetical protein
MDSSPLTLIYYIYKKKTELVLKRNILSNEILLEQFHTRVGQVPNIANKSEQKNTNEYFKSREK